MVQEQTVADATARYRSLKQEQPEGYVYEPSELVRLGDALRTKDRAEQAVGIYEFALSMDSTLVDAYAGLGLAQKTMGNRSVAETHLKAALDQNPGHEAAKRALRVMGVTVGAETVDVSAETLERYTGVYAARPRPSFKMTVTRQGDQLNTQATGQRKIKVTPISKTRFAAQGVDAQIEFTVKEDGSVPKLTLYQRGQEIVFERTDEGSQ
jgi:tetratricopeptide (TPR) repeat protein